MTEDTSSPSYERRQALRQAAATSARLVKASRPLKEYLTMAQRLYTAFGQAVDARQVDAAYVYGLRLANLALDALPRHPEWKQPYYTKEKRRLASQVDQALAQMEILKQRMNAEELMRQQQLRIQEENRQKMEEQKKREEEEQRRKREEAQRRFAEERQRVLEAQRKEQQEKAAAEASKKKQQAIQQSAIEKLQALQAQMNKSNDTPTQETAMKQTTKSAAESAPAAAEATTSTKTKSAQQNNAPSPTTQQSTAESIPKPNTSVATPVKVCQQSSTTPAASSPKPERKMTPRTSKEQATIELLQRAIKTQENRTEQIESKQIPQLVRVAKEHLRHLRSENDGQDVKTIAKDKSNPNPHRQAALQCLARKKKLERQLEISKTAIFQMETQIFMLENAMEDRQVQQTLAEASQAMASLRKHTVGDSSSAEDFAEDLAASLAADNNGIAHLDDEDEEELLEELQQWISSPEGVGEKGSREDSLTDTLTDEEAGMLALPPTLSASLPSVPANSQASAGSKKEENTSTSTSSSIRNLMKAVLG